MSFCRICLQRATPRTVDLDATLDAFYDELVYYDLIQHSSLTVCTLCEHLLRKAYNFRQRCRRAHILLKLWSKDAEKKVALNFLWKLLPKSSITVVNNNAVQKVFSCIDKKPETGTETIDNDGWASLVPIHYKQESKIDIKSYYQEFLSDTEFKPKDDDENNTTDFDNTENADPNRESDNESDVVFSDNFEDFFKSELRMESDDKKKATEKIKEKRLNKKRERTRALLEKFIADGLLKDLELDDETMLKWFDGLPNRTLLLKGMLNLKYCLLLDKWREFYRFLKHRYDPKYESVFDIEFLVTHEQKVAEFVARQHSEQFIKAPCKCFICFKVLPRRGLMEYHHKVWHDESLPIKCEICLCGFQNIRQLRNHMHNSHEVVYHCKHCPYVARTRDMMLIHFEEHVNGIFCKVCGKQFRTMKTMNQHLLCHKRGICCPFCARYFASLGLGTHTRSKHKDDPLYKATPALQCPDCDSAFHYEYALNVHITRDHTREYRCSCGEVFLDDMSLTTHTKETKHVRIKSETKINTKDVGVIRCDVCGVDVPNTSPYALRSHHRAEHPTLPYLNRDKRKGAVLCEHCGIACVLGQDYEDHLNTHSGDKPYECSECGARFETRALAEHHLKIHTKNREDIMKNTGIKYKCHVCAKEFGNKQYLRRHISIHEDFNRQIVTSRVVMPNFKVKIDKPKTLTKIDSGEHKDNESMESDENEKNGIEIKTEQPKSCPDPSMEAIFDFDNDVVEEVVL